MSPKLLSLLSASVVPKCAICVSGTSFSAITWVWDSHYMLLIKKGGSPGRVLRVPYLIVLTHYLAFHLFMNISKYFQAHSFSRLEAAKVQDINSGDGAR